MNGEIVKIEEASAETVQMLLDAGVIYFDEENVLHCAR